MISLPLLFSLSLSLRSLSLSLSLLPSFLQLIGDGGNSSEDVIVVKSYEAMRSNVSMLSNVTTDHAAPVFLKEMAPAVYSSLLYPVQHPGRKQGGVQGIYQSSSIPIYRLFSHPLPKINYTNQIYIDRGYLGATMIVLYMLITTIVSVRATTQMRKNGVKLQLHLAGRISSDVVSWM